MFTGKTAAYMLPILERLIYRPQNTTVTRVLVLAPTRELAIQVRMDEHHERGNMDAVY